MAISTQQFVDALSHSGLLSTTDLAALQDVDPKAGALDLEGLRRREFTEY